MIDITREVILCDLSKPRGLASAAKRWAEVSKMFVFKAEHPWPTTYAASRAGAPALAGVMVTYIQFEYPIYLQFESSK
jgi:hypothetical protein